MENLKLTDPELQELILLVQNKIVELRSVYHSLYEEERQEMDIRARIDTLEAVSLKLMEAHRDQAGSLLEHLITNLP